MDVHGWIALATLVAATILFITRLIPLPMTALGIPVVLYTTGVLTDARDALMGFGNQAVLAIGAVMVIGSALRESGVATLMARGLQRMGGSSEVSLITLLMLATAGLAAIMNNTAVVAILLPVAAVLAKRSGVAGSRLFMPMAFAAVLGGTITMIGTAPNMIVADFLKEYLADLEAAGKELPTRPMKVFDYAAVGIPITLAGIAFMVLVGRRLLPVVTQEDRIRAAQLPEEAAASYELPERLFEMRVVEGSGIAGHSIGESHIRRRYNLDVLMVRRTAALGQRWLHPEPNLVIEPGDHLYVRGDHEDAWHLAESELLQLGLTQPKAVHELLGRGTTLAEVTLSPQSHALGRTFKRLDFRKRHGLNVLALWRRGAALHRELGDVPLELGDSFLVSGSARHVRALARDPDYVVLTDQSQVEDVTRAPLAVLILLLALLPPILIDFPLAISALGASLLMIGTRCISRAGLRRAIDWQVLCVLVGTLPLGRALQQQGLSDMVGGVFGDIAAAGGSTAVYGGLFLLAAVFSVLTSNAAAAAIVAPVATSAAALVSMDPRLALLAMAYGCSCNFLLPFAQCNLLVMTPGGYQTRDYIRAGLPMSIVMAVATIAVLSL